MQSTQENAIPGGGLLREKKKMGEKKKKKKKKSARDRKLHKDKVTLEEILDLHLSQSPYRNITPKPLFLPK